MTVKAIMRSTAKIRVFRSSFSPSRKLYIDPHLHNI